MVEFVHRGKRYMCHDSIRMKQCDPEHLVLTHEFYYDGYIIPAGFRWNGASSPNTPLGRFIASKFYKNIKASCVHDFLCGMAKCHEQRKRADRHYFLLKKYVEQDDSWKCKLAYLGVRIGDKLGIGNSF